MRAVRVLFKRIESSAKINKEVIRRSYGSEAAEIANAVKQGRFSDVSSDQIERCPVCRKIFHEGMEGRPVDEVPPACALSEEWEKLWMKDHDSFDMFSHLSLDGSADTDDDTIQRAANESIVVPSSEDGKRKMKCGLYCCQDSK
eukprot:gene7366-7949_t